MKVKAAGWVLVFGALLGFSQCRKAEQPAVPTSQKEPAAKGQSAPAAAGAEAKPLKPEVGESKPLEMDRNKLVFVSDLKPTNVTFGFSEPRMDTAWEGSPLEYGTEILDKGVGMHAPSTISFAVPAKAVAFQARIGVAHTAVDCTNKVGFVVKNEAGKVLFSLPAVHKVDGWLDISVPLAGAREITLVADEAGDGRDCDHENWGLASFVFPDAASRPLIKEKSSAPK